MIVHVECVVVSMKPLLSIELSWHRAQSAIQMCKNVPERRQAQFISAFDLMPITPTCNGTTVCANIQTLNFASVEFYNWRNCGFRWRQDTKGLFARGEIKEQKYLSSVIIHQLTF